MANKVIQKNEIFLDGKYYPINKPVQQVLTSLYPPKVTIGDTSRDSQSRASVISWSDFRGGIGVENMEGAKDVDRAWWSTCTLRYKKHLVLPTKTTAVPGPVDVSLDIIQEYQGELYCIYADKKIYKYNSGNDDTAAVAWSSALNELPATATDALQVRMAGNTYLVIATGTGYTYVTAGESDGVLISGDTYTDDTKDTQFLAFWQDKLWGIDSTGQLWYAATLGSETNDAKLPLPDNYVTDLFVARNANGDPILYAMTKEGLYAHDATNARWVETQLALPFHNDNGKGSVRWRDSVYIPAGLGIYKYINGTNSAVVTIVGPDRDDGLPSDNRGKIVGLLGTHNDLIAMVDGTLAPGMTDMFGSMESPVIPDSTGFSAILGWNEVGWEVKWTATEAGKQITSSFVTDVGGNLASTNPYRLYWGFDGDLYYQQLQSDVINPNQIVNYNYESTGLLYTPWFNADQVEVDKLALKVKVDTANCSSGGTTENQKIKVEYALDGKEKNDDGTTAYVTLGTITSSDEPAEYTLASGVGIAFRSIQFKITLTTDNQTVSPDMLNLTLIFRKKLDTKFGWSVNLDMTKPYKGRSPKDMRADILSDIDSNTLLEFTYRDDSSTNRNYYVDIINAQGLEHTATDERGTTTILVSEP